MFQTPGCPPASGIAPQVEIEIYFNMYRLSNQFLIFQILKKFSAPGLCSSRVWLGLLLSSHRFLFFSFSRFPEIFKGFVQRRRKQNNLMLEQDIYVTLKEHKIPIMKSSSKHTIMFTYFGNYSFLDWCVLILAQNLKYP